MAEKDRPFLVTVIGVIYLLLGIIMLIGGIALAVGGNMVDLDIDIAADVGGGVAIVLGLIWIVIAAGFFKGWKLWWYLGIIFSIIGLIISILSLPAGIIALIIDLIILWYLFRPKVKSFFLD